MIDLVELQIGIQKNPLSYTQDFIFIVNEYILLSKLPENNNLSLIYLQFIVATIQHYKKEFGLDINGNFNLKQLKNPTEFSYRASHESNIHNQNDVRNSRNTEYDFDSSNGSITNNNLGSHSDLINKCNLGSLNGSITECNLVSVNQRSKEHNLTSDKDKTTENNIGSENQKDINHILRNQEHDSQKKIHADQFYNRSSAQSSNSPILNAQPLFTQTIAALTNHITNCDDLRYKKELLSIWMVFKHKKIIPDRIFFEILIKHGDLQKVVSKVCHLITDLDFLDILIFYGVHGNDKQMCFCFYVICYCYEMFGDLKCRKFLIDFFDHKHDNLATFKDLSKLAAEKSLSEIDSTENQAFPNLFDYRTQINKENISSNDTLAENGISQDHNNDISISNIETNNNHNFSHHSNINNNNLSSHAEANGNKFTNNEIVEGNIIPFNDTNNDNFIPNVFTQENTSIRNIPHVNISQSTVKQIGTPKKAIISQSMKKDPILNTKVRHILLLYLQNNLDFCNNKTSKLTESLSKKETKKIIKSINAKIKKEQRKNRIQILKTITLLKKEHNIECDIKNTIYRMLDSKKDDFEEILDLLLHNVDFDYAIVKKWIYDYCCEYKEDAIVCVGLNFLFRLILYYRRLYESNIFWGVNVQNRGVMSNEIINENQLEDGKKFQKNKVVESEDRNICTKNEAGGKENEKTCIKNKVDKSKEFKVHEEFSESKSKELKVYEEFGESKSKKFKVHEELDEFKSKEFQIKKEFSESKSKELKVYEELDELNFKELRAKKEFGKSKSKELKVYEELDESKSKELKAKKEFGNSKSKELKVHEEFGKSKSKEFKVNEELDESKSKELKAKKEFGNSKSKELKVHEEFGTKSEGIKYQQDSVKTTSQLQNPNSTSNSQNPIDNFNKIKNLHEKIIEKVAIFNKNKSQAINHAYRKLYNALKEDLEIEGKITDTKIKLEKEIRINKAKEGAKLKKLEIMKEKREKKKHLKKNKKKKLRKISKKR